MTRSAAASQLGPEFDDFLFAPIGEDRNGMPLSVVSALARLDVDPWQEAAELAKLPGGTATQRLASMISRLPNGSSAYPDSATIAARLIALLPRPASTKLPSHATLFGASAATPPLAVIYVYVIFMVLALGAQWIAASHQPPTQVGNVQAPTSSIISPQVRPPNSGQ